MVQNPTLSLLAEKEKERLLALKAARRALLPETVDHPADFSSETEHTLRQALIAKLLQVRNNVDPQYLNASRVFAAYLRATHDEWQDGDVIAAIMTLMKQVKDELDVRTKQTAINVLAPYLVEVGIDFSELSDSDLEAILCKQLVSLFFAFRHHRDDEELKRAVDVFRDYGTSIGSSEEVLTSKIDAAREEADCIANADTQLKLSNKIIIAKSLIEQLRMYSFAENKDGEMKLRNGRTISMACLDDAKLSEERVGLVNDIYNHFCRISNQVNAEMSVDDIRICNAKIEVLWVAVTTLYTLQLNWLVEGLRRYPDYVKNRNIILGFFGVAGDTKFLIDRVDTFVGGVRFGNRFSLSGDE